jgi:Transcriptional regulator, AbiEi antitoxin
MTPDQRALAHAARQGGVIDRQQALACGLSRSAIDRRLGNGDWKRVRRSVYRLIDLTEPKDLLRAAVGVLPSAVVSHESAAEIHRFPTVATGRAVVSVHTRSTHVFPGVVVHRNHDLAASHVVEIDDLPVTTIPRTIIDLGLFLSHRHLRRVVDDLIAARRVTVEQLSTTFDQVAKKGKPGSKSMRRILEERGAGPEANATTLELLGLQLMREGGLPDPVIEYPIPWDNARRLDAAYPSERVGIEWDSRRWHGLIDAFERDRRRDRAALLHGWTVFRFTWLDVTDRPAEVVETVRMALRNAQTVGP